MNNRSIINSRNKEHNKTGTANKSGRFQLTGKIHPWTTFCEGISDIEAGFRYYEKLYRRNYSHLLPEDKDAMILVTSAGVGYFMTFLNQKGYKNFVGVDSDEHKIDYAKDKGIKVLHENAFDFLNNTEQMFDLIVAEQEINHLTKRELILFLTMARKRLNENGRLILNTYNYANPITAIDHFGHNFDHFAGYTENSLKQVFKYCGFGGVKCYPIDNYVFYWNPLNWIAKMIAGLFSFSLWIIFKMYGKSDTLFTKRIIGVGFATGQPMESFDL
jgi:2-polyprenyl-3-methyl-5-hydroxy-6-metoxy-1,4-benzoquinol methylase